MELYYKINIFEFKGIIMKKLLLMLSLLISVFLQAADLSDQEVSTWLLTIINQCQNAQFIKKFNDSVSCELANLNMIFATPNNAPIQTKFLLAMRNLCKAQQKCLFGGKNYLDWFNARPVNASPQPLGNYTYTEEDKARWQEAERLTILGKQKPNLGIGSLSPRGSVSSTTLRAPSPQQSFSPNLVYAAIAARRQNRSDSGGWE
jgi:hypothetical protein